MQKGGVKGRKIMDHVIMAEARGLEVALQGNSRAGNLLTDFVAAFPSLIVEWVLAVLVAMEVPPDVVAFVSKLYRNNTGIIMFAGQKV